MDPYEILGVDRGGSQDDINEAWRAAAMRLHPDKNASPTAREEFQRAKDAADLLLDPHRRSLHDMGAGDDAKLCQAAVEAARGAVMAAMLEFTAAGIAMRHDIGPIIRGKLHASKSEAVRRLSLANIAIKNTKRLLRIAKGGMLSAMLEENLRDAEKGVERARLEIEALRWAQRLVAREGFDWSKDEPEHGLLTLTNALQQWTSEEA